MPTGKKTKNNSYLLTKIGTSEACVAIQSALSKTDNLENGTQCPSKNNVCLIESQIKGAKKGRNQL